MSTFIMFKRALLCKHQCFKTLYFFFKKKKAFTSENPNIHPRPKYGQAKLLGSQLFHI